MDIIILKAFSGLPTHSDWLRTGLLCATMLVPFSRILNALLCVSIQKRTSFSTGVLRNAGGLKKSGGASSLVTRVVPWDCLRRWAYVENAGGLK